MVDIVISAHQPQLPALQLLDTARGDKGELCKRQVRCMRPGGRCCPAGQGKGFTRRPRLCHKALGDGRRGSHGFFDGGHVQHKGVRVC